MKANLPSLRKFTSLALAIVILSLLVFGSMAFFSDRASSTLNISTASFTKDGYTISREYNDVYYTAGEDIKVKVTEDNEKEDNVKSVVTMSVEWVSPDTSVFPFGNDNADANAVITVDGTVVKYTVNNDGTITFQLPEHKMDASTTGNERELVFHIPESLKSTGKLNFTFDSVKLSQVTAMGGSGFYAEYDRSDLNAQEKLDFTAKVVWDFSKNQDKSVIGYLTGSAGNYGITVEGEGAMYNWASETSSKQSNYKGSVTSLNLGSGITTIGDHAFDDFNKVTSLTIPETVKSIGGSAFENTAIKSLTIPAKVTELGELAFGNIEQLTAITFNGTDITFPTAGEGSGAFYVGSPYSESDPLRTKITANSSDVLDYNWTADHRGYTVTVKNADHGTLTANPTVAINGKTINLKATADTGYLYEGATVSYKDENGASKTIELAADKLTFTMPASDVSVTSKWTPISYSVKYDANGGSGTMDNSVHIYDTAKALTKNTFTKTGYTFAGWAESADGAVKYTDEQSVKNLTATDGATVNLYAKWTPITYTVKYNGNGGSGTMADSTHTYDVAKALTKNAFTKSGYEFAGWATSASGSVVYADQASVKNLTATNGATVNLYAKWNLTAVPMLAESNSWQYIKNADGSYTQVIDYQTASLINTINIVNSYTPNGTETSWDASAYETVNGKEYSGTVTAYLSADKKTLTLAGNGTGKIYANPDSYRAFAGFSNVTAINGANIFEMNTATDTSSMFCDDYKLVTLDVSNWDVRNVTNMAQMFYMCYELPSLNVAGWDTGNVTNMSYMFNDCEQLTALTGIRNWDTQKVTNMRRMFLGCNSIPSLDLSTKSVTLNGRTYDSWDTGEVTDMSYMFGNSPEVGCELESLNVSTFDMRKVTNMQAMFQGCTSLKALNLTPTQYTLNGDTFHSWDVAKVQKMNLAFKNCSSLTTLDLSAWDTSGVGTVDTYTDDDFSEMFAGCTSLQTLNVTRKNMSGINGRSYTSWNTSNAVQMTSMFEDCSSLKSLDLKNWNNASATDMDWMFSGCSAMTQINLTNFTTGACQYMDSMFYDCSSLNSLDLSSFDTSKVKNMSYMFYNCDGLKTLDLAHFVTSSVNRISGMFEDCSNLTTIYATHRFDVSALSYNTDDMFKNTPVLVGGAGTPWDSGIIDKTRALVDGTDGKAGYFTNNIFLEYDPAEISVGETTDPTLTIKSTVFDDYTSKSYSIVSGSSYASVNASTGVVTGKAGGTVTVQVTLGASNGDTITAQATVKVTQPLIAQALYSATDNSLTFVRDPLYRAGDTFVDQDGDSKTVTAVYTGFEEASYKSSTVPWRTYRSSVTSVVFEDEIKPVDTSYWFYNFTNCSSFEVTKLNVSSVSSMKAMFQSAGKSATTFDVGDLSNWDTSNVENMSSMFSYAGNMSTTFNIGNLDNWDTSEVTDMSSMFGSAGSSATTFNIGDLSEWNVSSVQTMSSMFRFAGESATTFNIGDLSEWNVSSVQTMFNMFQAAGQSATTFNIGDLSEWNVSSVQTMSGMFQFAGQSATTFDVGDLSNWDTSKVTNMSGMFLSAGYSATTFDIGDLSNWDVSKVTEFGSVKTTLTDGIYENSYGMFQSAGYSATSFNIGDLSKWDTSSATSMACMFIQAGYNASYSLDLSGWNVSKVTNALGFNDFVESKVIAPSFTTAMTLSLTDDFELPEGVIVGEAQTINAMPDVATLNEEAEANAPENTILYGWLVDSGMAQQIVLLEEFEDALNSVYGEEPEWEMTITPLYQAVETEPSEEPEATQETEPSEEPESTEGTEPSEEPESTEGTEPSEEPESTEGTEPSEEPESTEGTEPSEEPESTEGTEPSEEPEATEETKPSEEPAATEETKPVDETEPSEEVSE